MATVDDPNTFVTDEAYEFSAPRFFDFIEGETEEEMRKAELWFDTALSYAPSPFMPKIKTSRTVQIDSLCDFSEAEQPAKSESVESEVVSGSVTTSNYTEETEKKVTIAQPALSSAEGTEAVKGDGYKEVESANRHNQVTANEKTLEEVKEAPSVETESVVAKCPTSSVEVQTVTVQTGVEACTPKPRSHFQKGNNHLQTEVKKQQTAKKIASLVRNPSTLKSKLSQSTHVTSESVRRNKSMLSKVGTPNLAQENQAIKRQKLDDGKTRQILNVKTHTLPHKTRSSLLGGPPTLSSSAAKVCKEGRKIYTRGPPAAPFVSMAELMNKFQSNTREMSLSCPGSSISRDAAGSVMRRKPLTLTRPKEPELETSQRVRSVRIKSSAELEEEMMAKIPKFKAHPVNKKILEAPTLPTLSRSTPRLPEFQEFHLETMARANHNVETSTVASTETVPQDQQWKPRLTAPKPPTLQTSLRARPPTVKSSQELEKEELEKIPKFKARPLNKKIFESKGELGVFCNTKKQVTVPQEFHFAIDERIPPPSTVCDLFDKLSLNSEPQQNKLPRNTAPSPFHLHTEERGLQKETKFVTEVIQKQLEEEKARVPKANPYPYTTDYPVIPPKPEPKPCTKPEPFQLESLVRHEEEMQREMEERQRMEREEAQKRLFKAQPILKEDPIPVPEKVRLPLTEVQAFDLQVEHRAVDRADFDKKIKEKEMIYKRYREEAESEKMMEEEKALKQLRRTLVPHARPVPNFNHPFLPQKSTKEATKPKSPKLKIIERKQRRKMMMRSIAAATSSSASNMR